MTQNNAQIFAIYPVLCIENIYGSVWPSQNKIGSVWLMLAKSL